MLKVVNVFQNGFLNFSCFFSNAPKNSYLTPKERYSLNHEKRVWHSNEIKHGNCHFLANFLKTMCIQMCHQHSIFLKTLEGMSGWINILLSPSTRQRYCNAQWKHNNEMAVNYLMPKFLLEWEFLCGCCWFLVVWFGIWNACVY